MRRRWGFREQERSGQEVGGRCFFFDTAGEEGRSSDNACRHWARWDFLEYKLMMFKHEDMGGASKNVVKDPEAERF